MRRSPITTILVAMTHTTLRDARLAAGLTQAQLAAAVGTTTMQIWRFEKGHRPITHHWAGLFAPVLDTDAASLLSDMSKFPTSGQSRPIGRAQTRAMGGRQEPEGDFVEDRLERMILRFWRNLPVEGQDIILREMMTWSEDRVRTRVLSAPQASQIAARD